MGGVEDWTENGIGEIGRGEGGYSGIRRPAKVELKRDMAAAAAMDGVVGIRVGWSEDYKEQIGRGEELMLLTS